MLQQQENQQKSRTGQMDVSSAFQQQLVNCEAIGATLTLGQNGEWMEGVRRQLARVNGEVNAWKNITTFIFKHLLENAGKL